MLNSNLLPGMSFPPQDSNGNLHTKLFWGLIYFFLGPGIDPDVNLKSGWTSLMLAASTASSDLMELLISRGANANFQKGIHQRCGGSFFILTVNFLKHGSVFLQEVKFALWFLSYTNNLYGVPFTYPLSKRWKSIFTSSWHFC